MQYYWLNKQNNDRLIMFFCGWSFDDKPFQHLKCNNYDILVIYDYTNTNFSDYKKAPLNLPTYKSTNLIAWSMGVYIAYINRNLLPKFDTKIAINGTPYPIHDEWGIPTKTFDLTLKYVDTGLQGKFQKNLFKNPKDYEIYLKNPVGRTIKNQKEELIALNDFIKQKVCDYEKFYDRAIISDTDKIIPTRNQLNFWENKAEIITLNSGHFPFFEFNNWEEILKCQQILN